MPVNNFEYHSFMFGLQNLRGAYALALSAVQQLRRDIDDRFATLSEQVKQGKASFEEMDHEGQLIYDHGEAAGEAMWENDETQKHICEAFLISLYHFWERRLGEIMQVDEFNAAHALAYLNQNGGDVDFRQMRALRLVVNTLKHSEGVSADELQRCAPSLLDQEEMDLWSHMEEDRVSPGYQYVSVTPEDVQGFFDAVARAMPKPQGGHPFCNR